MTPAEIVAKMMEKDEFSQWLGISVVEIEKGKCVLAMNVRHEMLNGFHIAHGGISYSISDSALAFAANAYGFQCVSIETSISHLKPLRENDQLTTLCTEINRGKSIGLYEVKTLNQDQELVAYFKGTVKISREEWS
ncbi:MAG: hotdog fold thioesterase [Crocinitomicaceae bacterium]